MPDPNEARIREEAIAWHLQLADAGDEQWAQFTRWLQADPRHNSAYEAVADDDEFLGAALAQGGPARSAVNDDTIAPAAAAGGRNWRWPALAASVALVLGLAFLLLPGGGPDRYQVATAAGETRIVRLDGGSVITLNGDTRLELDRGEARFAQLLSGEARFDVRHDASHPFVVVAGSQRITDTGTAFDVALDGGDLTLDVAEGAVRYEGYGRAFDMKAGATLAAASDGRIVLGEKPPELMAGWSRGELVYRGESLSKVVRDLRRASGISISVSPDIAKRSFSGVIQTRGSRAELHDRLESVLGVRVTETNDGWMLEP